MPTLRSSRSLHAPEKAEVISAAPPTSATTMNPTNAGVIPNAAAACCTDSTNTSLTSATSTVAPASVAKARPMGQGASPVSPCSALVKSSRCVFRENSMPRPYATMSSTARPKLNFWVNAAAFVESTCEIAEGISNATVATKSKPACTRALTRLYSCTWCLSPPKRNDAPNTNNVFVTIAPATDAFTSVYCPACKAASAITSSVRFPSVALSRPPTASPVLYATDSVA
jgi:hypothetical protein